MFFKKIFRKKEKLKNRKTFLTNNLKNAEEKHLEIEERDRFQAVFTNLTEGFLIFDEKNKLILINSRAEKIFDIEGKKIIGKSISDIALTPFLKLLTEFLKEGEKIKTFSKKELIIKEDLILKVSSIPLAKEGRELGILVILRNVARRKTLERIKTEFIALLAHQLRMPLSAIKWSTKMLISGDAGKLTNEQKNYFDKIYQSNERMIDLINKLLDTTKIEEGRYVYKLTVENIENLIKSIIKIYKQKIEEKKIKFVFKGFETEIPETKMDVEKIPLVIENLLNNAIRYTSPDGEIVMSLLKHNTKEIEFSIKDSGIGIPASQQGKIFTKFFRGTNAVRTEPEGSGLGLFIAKNIIEAHKGRMWFESEEGKGTTFYFTLPIEK